MPHAALVLGAGGAARAAVRALELLGTRRITVATRRRPEDAEWFVSRGCQLHPWTSPLNRWVGDVVVQATPIGMGSLASGKLPSLAWAEGMVAMDLAYSACLTPFLATASTSGASTVDGLEILARQAAASWQLWTGLHVAWPSLLTPEII